MALVGIRSLDEGEKRRLKETGVQVHTMSDIDRHGIHRIMKKALARVTDGTDYVHVSFDLDAVDPTVAPGVGTPVKGGLDYREAHLIMELLHDSGVMTSLEMVEVNPDPRPGERVGHVRGGAGAVGVRQEDPLALHRACGARHRRRWPPDRARTTQEREIGSELAFPLSGGSDADRPLRLAGARPRRRHGRNGLGADTGTSRRYPACQRSSSLPARTGAGRAPPRPGDTLEATPGPAWPDALFGEPEEAPIPARIAGLRLA